MVNRYHASIPAIHETFPANSCGVTAFDRPLGDTEGLNFGVDVLEGSRRGVSVGGGQRDGNRAKITLCGGGNFERYRSVGQHLNVLGKISLAELDR